MADPFVAMNSIQAANRNESLPLFVEYGYDFDKQCFRYDEKGQNLMVTENEALKVWIYKATWPMMTAMALPSSRIRGERQTAGIRQTRSAGISARD